MFVAGLTATIVKAYLSKNTIELASLPSLITGVGQSLQELTPSLPEETPAPPTED